MAILINVYQDKRKNSNKLWYGKAITPLTIDTRALAQRIQSNVSVKESDVYAVLIELAEVMTYELSLGHKVQLDRFGYFWYGIKSSGALQSKEWSVPENLKGFHINFVLSNTRTSEGKVASKALGGQGLKAEVYSRNGVIESLAPKETNNEGE